MCWQRISKSSSARKDNADRKILITFGKEDHKSVQFIKIPSKASARIRGTNLADSDEYPYQSNDLKKDSDWSHFKDLPNAQEKEHMQGQHTIISVTGPKIP